MTDKKDNKIQKNRSTAVKKRDMITALKNNKMHISLSVKEAEISRDVYYQWLKKDKKFVSKVEEAQNWLHDLAEEQLNKEILKSNFKAIKFYLETKGKSRGYVKKQEIEHKGQMITATRKMTKQEIDELMEDVKSEKQT
jgi:hypothetical protein